MGATLAVLVAVWSSLTLTLAVATLTARVWWLLRGLRLVDVGVRVVGVTLAATLAATARTLWWARAALVEPWSPGTLVGRVLGAEHRVAVGSGHVSRLVALLALHDVELDLLTFAHALLVLLRVVFDDGALVNEYVLLVVLTIDETVAVLDVEPFYGTGYFGGYDFLLD